jgi:hypothetical protein
MLSYNEEMFGRRKKKNKTVNETQPEPPPPDRAPNIDKPPPVTVGVDKETGTPPVLTDAFKSTIEKAADGSRSELASEGKLKPMAFFVNADGAMKTASLSVKDGYQNDALIGRIREKALEENIPTVNEVQNILTLCISMACKVTTNNSSCTALSTPAMDIDGLTLKDCVVDLIENVPYMLRGWSSKIDGPASASYVEPRPSGIAHDGILVRRKGVAKPVPFILFHEVDQVSDSDPEEPLQLLLHPYGIKIPGIILGKEFVGRNPVGLRKQNGWGYIVILHHYDAFISSQKILQHFQ